MRVEDDAERFYADVVRETVEEFAREQEGIRRGVLAALAVGSLLDHTQPTEAAGGTRVAAPSAAARPGPGDDARPRGGPASPGGAAR